VRTGVASAFDITFFGIALMLVLAWTLFFKVEDRPLSHRTDPAAEVE